MCIKTPAPILYADPHTRWPDMPGRAIPRHLTPHLYLQRGLAGKAFFFKWPSPSILRWETEFRADVLLPVCVRGGAWCRSKEAHVVPVCSHDNNDPHKKIIRRENEKTILRTLDEYLFFAHRTITRLSYCHFLEVANLRFILHLLFSEYFFYHASVMQHSVWCGEKFS